MNQREFCLVRPAPAGWELKTKHFLGFPPEVTGTDMRKQLPMPRVMLLVTDAGGVFLKRYTRDGLFVGDTWHPNVQEAKEQATFEFGPLMDRWEPIPDGALNEVEYAVSRIPHAE